MGFLQNGEKFPELKIATVGGDTLSIPQDLAGSYGVVLIYRGSWCPYCNAQLAAFGRAQDKLAAVNAKVVALSVDDEASAAETVDKYKLTFPVGHDADADAVSVAIGSYTNREPKYLQSTGFVLDPDGTVITAVYSSGAIGRLVPDDVVGFLRYIQSEH
ncbi:peroxiredoxin family protein [Mycobacterium sp.]|uniref:peroxiredoxin family protein n=1 Tax=Mycobacterium sp. TaxID=1785 RepID=UPI002D15689D|nr:peroxiredoxin family protein [Mycobacterium sp.]HME49289.1 peroxiredoxin family protein [Mycobacterium sp.]